MASLMQITPVIKASFGAAVDRSAAAIGTLSRSGRSKSKAIVMQPAQFLGNAIGCYLYQCIEATVSVEPLGIEWACPLRYRPSVGRDRMASLCVSRSIGRGEPSSIWP